MGEILRYDPKLPSILHAMPRNNPDGKAEPIMVELPAAIVYHYGNAFEPTPGKIAFEMVAYDDAKIFEFLRDWRSDKQTEFVEATSDEPFDREEFVNAVAAQAIGMVPTREMIRDGLVITMKPKVIILGSEMIAERNLAKSLALETTRITSEQTKIDLEIDAKRRIEEIKVDEVTAETRREREVKERIREMKIEAARHGPRCCGRVAGHKNRAMTIRYAAVMPTLFQQEFETAFALKDEEHRVGAEQVCYSPE